MGEDSKVERRRLKFSFQRREVTLQDRVSYAEECMCIDGVVSEEGVWKDGIWRMYF